MPYRKTTVFWETPYRETTVFESHDPKYYTTSDWLAPGKKLQTFHTGRQLCLGNAMQGDHCAHGRPRETTAKKQENHWFLFAPAGSKFTLRSPSKNHVKYYPRSMTVELVLPNLDQSILNALRGWASIGATIKNHDPKYHTTSDWLAP